MLLPFKLCYTDSKVNMLESTFELLVIKVSHETSACHQGLVNYTYDF